MRLILKQEGSRITGDLVSFTGALDANYVGRVEGTINGDVVALTSARLRMELTVNGDELSGEGSRASGHLLIKLRRWTRAAPSAWVASFRRDPMVSDDGFGSAPTPWAAVQPAAWAAVKGSGWLREMMRTGSGALPAPGQLGSRRPGARRFSCRSFSQQPRCSIRSRVPAADSPGLIRSPQTAQIGSVLFLGVGMGQERNVSLRGELLLRHVGRT
jgi:hypothetical protein